MNELIEDIYYLAMKLALTETNMENKLGFINLDNDYLMKNEAYYFDNDKTMNVDTLIFYKGNIAFMIRFKVFLPKYNSLNSKQIDTFIEENKEYVTCEHYEYQKPTNELKHNVTQLKNIIYEEQLERKLCS